MYIVTYITYHYIHTYDPIIIPLETPKLPRETPRRQLDMPTLPLPHSLQPSPVSQHRQVPSLRAGETTVIVSAKTWGTLP